MTSFKVLAQSYTTTQRITRTVSAASAERVLAMVATTLSNAGFYVVSIEPV